MVTIVDYRISKNADEEQFISLILEGEVIFLQSGALFLYATSWFVIIHRVSCCMKNRPYEQSSVLSIIGIRDQRGVGYRANRATWGNGMTRLHMASRGLILTQLAHIVEEYVRRLWELIPPARFFTELISQNLLQVFLVIKTLLVAFAVWCFFLSLGGHRKGTLELSWLWIGFQLVSGYIGHIFLTFLHTIKILCSISIREENASYTS